MQKMLIVLGILMLSSLWSTVSAATVESDRIASTTPAAVEAKVRAYFADIPVMVTIAECESKFRQFTDSGEVFYGGAGEMIGVFQFYELIHKEPARALGYDLSTVEGNLGYARHLYREEGVRPWQSCVPTSTATISDSNAALRIQLMLQIIDLLRQLIALKQSGG